jgi:lipoate-protein ligase B
MKEFLIVDLRLADYKETWSLQRRLVPARKAGAIGDVLLICEHPHVITLGRSGRREHLLASEHLLRQMGVEFIPTDRGGDITYHGPGQLVGYPILNLADHRRDVGWYIRQLEETMIRTTLDFGFHAVRKPGRTGIWIDEHGEEKKLGAIGVHLSRWVTSHGFAYNVATDLRYFDLMVPCGIAGRGVTSLQRLLHRSVSLREALTPMVVRFGEVFEREPQWATRGELEQTLASHEQTLEPVAAE